MSSLNKVTLIGRLGKDPELRYTKTQTPFARFSVATSEQFVTNGEKREKTEWHNVVVWGKQAEIAGRYLRKGKQIYLEGRIEYRDYEDQNGQRRYTTDIKVDRFIMLGSAQGSGGGYGASQDGDYGSPQGHGGGYGAPQGGGYGGSGGKNSGGGYGEQSGRGPSAEPEPMSYGDPMSAKDIPESDDFSDDDIPF